MNNQLLRLLVIGDRGTHRPSGGSYVTSPDAGSIVPGGDEAASIPATMIQPVTTPNHTIPRPPEPRILIIDPSSDEFLSSGTQAPAILPACGRLRSQA